MSNYKILLSLFILMSFSFSQILFHKIVDKSDYESPISIDVFVSIDETKIKSLKLYYKSENQINYIENLMTKSTDGFYYGIIPATFSTIKRVDYYILLELKNGKLYSFPYDNPISDPVKIKIIDTKKVKKRIQTDNLKNDVQILSPLPNARVYKDDLLVSLSYFKLKNIDISKTKVFLNKREITKKVKFYDNYFIYKPEFIIEGQYSVEVIFVDNYNRQLTPFNWKFTILSNDRLSGLSTMFTHSGRISSNYSLNSNNSDELEVLNLNFDYRPNFDFLKLRTKIKWSNDVSDYQQDKNRYLVQFNAPYINLELMDSYPYINQYALNSFRIRGLNFKFDSKFFDLNIIQGDLANSHQGDPNDRGLVFSNYNNNDTLNFSIDNYAFRRNIFALNLGFGNPESFFYNLNFVKAKDNINSLLSFPNNLNDHRIEIDNDYLFLLNNNIEFFDTLLIINDNDTTINYSISYGDLKNLYQNQYNFNILTDNWSGDTPKDNLVIGSNLKWYLDNKNIIFNFGSSLSLLNQNTWEPVLSIESLDTLFDNNQDGMIMEDLQLPDNINFSDYEDIFKFSFNQVPLIPIDISSGKIGLEQILTMPSLAYNIDLSLKYISHNIKMGIKQIGPEYKSLANPYLQTDIREQFINDRFRLLNKKLFIDMGFKRTEDGIEVSKKSLSKTDKYNLTMNYYPGYDLPNYSLSINMSKRDNGIDSLDVFTYQEFVGVGVDGADDLGYKEVSDTTNRRENTNSFQTNFSISYNYKFFGNHNILFNISQTNKKDLLFNEVIEYDSLYFSPQSFNQMLLLNLKSTWTKMWKSNLNLNYNYFNYSKDTPFYQQQVLKQIDLKGYYYRQRFINLIKVGFNYTRANGNLSYDEFGSSFSTKLEVVKNIFCDINYEFRLRETDSSFRKNQYYYIKISYKF